MINIGITGCNGLIGQHLRAFFYSMSEFAVIPANRETFQSTSTLNKFVQDCDIVIHLAGMNRGQECEILDTNIGLAQKLIETCEKGKHTPHIIFASSIHVKQNSAYGESKRRAAELLHNWAKSNGAHFTNLILPHVFGEYGKPFYNSVVSTFCHQIANKIDPEVINDSKLQLVHTQVVAQEILGVIKNSCFGEVSIPGTEITVKQLLEKLAQMAHCYEQGIIPNMNSNFERDLFNTYRSYLYPKYYPVLVNAHVDTRGTLFEAVKSLVGGQCFISTTKAGITRGNHYHLRKIERFLVLSGEAKIEVRKLFTNNTIDFNVSGSNPQFIDIPTLHTHSITNTGEEDLVTLFWANEIFDPHNPDTYVEKV